MIKLRTMTQDDVPEVVAIENLNCPAPWSEKIFRDCIKVGYNCWVFVRGKKIIGFGLLSVHVNEAHVLNVSIHPKFQRQGLGLRIMRYLIRKSKEMKAEIVYLEVRESNRGARKLYENLKFVEIGVRKSYYELPPDGREDAIIFVLNLN